MPCSLPTTRAIAPPRAASPTCLTLTSPSLHFIGPCSLSFIRTSAFAPCSCGPMCLISWRFPKRAWTPRLSPSRRLEAALTLTERVPRFGSHPRLGFPSATTSPNKRGMCHGRWQGFGRHFRLRGIEGDRAGRGGLLGRVVRPVSHDRTGARGDRRHAERQGQDREAQRR